MTGAPAPYSMVNDNTMMLLFILNIVGISYVFLMNGASIIERIKCIFYYESKSTPFNDRTHITWICNLLLYAQTIFYSVIVAIGYLQESKGLVLDNNAIPACATFAALFTGVLLLKKASYAIVNNILYTKKEAQEFREIYFFTIKILGFVLAPAAIALLFIPALSVNYVNFYLLLTLVAYIYTIINGLFRIIFTKKGNYLEIFLYLCALEFLPTAMVWKSVLQLSEFITIKI